MEIQAFENKTNYCQNYLKETLSVLYYFSLYMSIIIKPIPFTKAQLDFFFRWRKETGDCGPSQAAQVQFQALRHRRGYQQLKEILQRRR